MLNQSLHCAELNSENSSDDSPWGACNLKTVWVYLGGERLKRKGVDLLIYIKTTAGYHLYFSFFCMVSKSLHAETIEAQVT